LVLASNDFFLFYVAVELQSLALYFLAASDRNSLFSVEAGSKYFTVGSFASALLLLSLLTIYSSFSTLNFSQLNLLLLNFSWVFASSLSYNLFFFFGVLPLFFSLLIKLGIAPFHKWVPDVYDGVPLFVTFIFSILPKIVLLFFFFKVWSLLLFIGENYFLVNFLSTIFLLSIGLGFVGALMETRVKRFVAFSSIGNTSLLLFTLIQDSYFSLIGVIFFASIYFLSYLFLFALLNLYETTSWHKLSFSWFDLKVGTWRNSFWFLAFLY